MSDQKMNIDYMNDALNRSRMARTMRTNAFTSTPIKKKPEPIIPCINDSVKLLALSRDILSRVLDGKIDKKILRLTTHDESYIIDGLKNSNLLCFPSIGMNGLRMFARRCGSDVYLIQVAIINNEFVIKCISPAFWNYNKDHAWTGSDDKKYSMSYNYHHEMTVIVDCIQDIVGHDLSGVVLECICLEPGLDVKIIMNENGLNQFNNPNNA